MSNQLTLNYHFTYKYTPFRNNIRFLLICSLLSSVPWLLPAQTDRDFWFVAPNICESHGDTGIYLRLTTFTEPALITISEPANTVFFPDIHISMSANSSYSLNLSLLKSQVENQPWNSVNPYGIHITSTRDITVCYDETSPYNTERFTLKGRNALGKFFFIPSQNYYRNSPSYIPLPYNSFDIVATEDSTRVKIVPSHNLQGAHSAGDTITIILMEGETYSCVASDQDPSYHLMGSVVIADKPIAVTITDDSLEKNPPYTCADLIGDQIVPEDIVGNEYVIVRGYLFDALKDRVFLISSQDNNNIFLNGTLTTTIDKGEMYVFPIDSIQPVAYLLTDEPVYVYHISGYGCELGDALIPSIKCTGSTRVAFTRVTSAELGIMLVTSSGAEDNFIIDGSTTKITASMFSPVPGTSNPQLVYARIVMPVDSVNIGPHLITNASGYFSLGIINSTLSGTSSASYGYFSDFSSLNLGPDDDICPGTPRILDAGAGIQRTYLWSTGETTQTITITQPGKYWVTVSEAINNCIMSDTVIFTGRTLPIVDVSGDTLKCVGETGTLTAIGGPFTSYLWSTGATTSSISFTASGLYKVTVSNGFCEASDSLQVTVSPILPVSITIESEPPDSTCEGNAVTFIAIPVNGGASPTFQWLVNGSPMGANNDTLNFTPANHDVIQCVLTSSFPCISGNPATSGPITYTTVPYATPAISISGNHGGNPVCLGTSVTYTAVPVNGGTSPTYQWQVNGFDQGTNSPQFTFNPVNGDIVTCIMTSAIYCPAANPVTSNAVTMTVLDNPVSITVTSDNNVCEATPVTFTANPVNGGSSPAYQWKVNGVNQGTNDPSYTYVPADGDLITCTLTSNIICPSGNPAASPPVNMVVIPNAVAGIIVTPSPDPVCEGTPVTFTATPVNGGTNPSYQWKVNGVNQGTNNPVFSYTPAAGDEVTCQIISNYPCPIVNQATSSPVQVYPNLPVSISITGDNNGNPVCIGDAVAFTAVGVNPGPDPVYQWMVNGVNQGTNNPTFSYNPSNGDVVTCTLTSDAICPTGNPAVSNPIAVTVIDNPVSVSITASANNVCPGTQVTFSAATVNGGVTPIFQWKVNSTIYGINQDVFTYIPVDGDTVSCELTSNINCPTGNPATSNLMIMTVFQNLPVSVSLTSSDDTVCAGDTVQFTATPVNGGAAPQYEWTVNGTIQSESGPIFTYIPSDQDNIQVQLNSSYFCPLGNPALSGILTVTVNEIPVVSFVDCNDIITSTGAQPFLLKGGNPPGGIFTGPGVDPLTGIFDPAAAGTGVRTIVYTYTNTWSCSDTALNTVTVLPEGPFTCGQNLIDIRDNKIYPTVLLGGYCWMAANLNYGNQINSTIHQRDNCTNEKYCWHDIAAFCNQSGGLYQWNEVMQYAADENHQGLCPPGWHIPSESEWKALFDLFFPSPTIENAYAGDFLKWTGSSGFKANLDTILNLNLRWNFDRIFPDRYLQTCCPADSSVHHLHATFFWSSSPNGNIRAWSHGMNNYDPSVSRYPAARSNAFYVRCRKD